MALIGIISLKKNAQRNPQTENNLAPMKIQNRIIKLRDPKSVTSYPPHKL